MAIQIHSMPRQKLKRGPDPVRFAALPAETTRISPAQYPHRRTIRRRGNAPPGAGI